MRLLIIFMITFISSSSLAHAIEADKTAARIMVYYGVGHDDSPATSVRLSQFKAHLRELNEGNYNVVALPDLLNAYNKNAPLPENTVVITFDGSEKSIMTHAAPLLKKYKFPFTVFLAPKRIRDNSPRYLDLKDIKRLQKMQLVSFGLHPENYGQEHTNDTVLIRKNLNNAVSFYRDVFKQQPQYFAFSHGFYTAQDLSIIKNYGFKMLFGEHSGVVYQNKKNTVLPRFVMTENYADQRRFKMTANALPIPTENITPQPSVIPVNTPMIGFTTIEGLNLEKLSCYASGQAKPTIEKLGNRIEIRLKQKINDPRFRVNCTLPVIDKESNQPIKWRWLGLLLSVKEFVNPPPA